MMQSTYIITRAALPEKRARLKRLSHAKGRAAVPVRDASIIRWTMDRQEEAVDRGFFVEREYRDNHARVIPLPHKGRRTDADIICELERSRFHRDGFASIALAFIEQQDTHGYSGAWDERSARFTPTLIWYKDRKAAQRKASVARRAPMRALAQARWRKPT